MSIFFTFLHIFKTNRWISTVVFSSVVTVDLSMFISIKDSHRSKYVESADSRHLLISLQLKDNPTLSGFFQRMTYSSFQKLADAYLEKEAMATHNPPTIPHTAPELIKLAFTYDFTAKVARLSRQNVGHITGLGNRYLEDRFEYKQVRVGHVKLILKMWEQHMNNNHKWNRCTQRLGLKLLSCLFTGLFRPSSVWQWQLRGTNTQKPNQSCKWNIYCSTSLWMCCTPEFSFSTMDYLKVTLNWQLTNRGHFCLILTPLWWKILQQHVCRRTSWAASEGLPERFKLRLQTHGCISWL